MIMNELDLTGETLNNYKIISKLGRGGMATVYKAHELSLNRVVALKVLSTQLSADKEYIKRFQREAQSAAQLNHPGIVQVFSIGEEKGIYYFAMEYIKGTSLADIKKEIGAFMPDKAVTIIKQVADALGHAHNAGLVHRDVKPSNIMIDASGKAKVTDFGIAYVLSAETKLTREGSIIGTPEYLSPEQCEGKTVDQRSDIYSLGVTFYELVTGKTPYEADTPVSMLMKIVKGTFPPICDVNPNVPAPLCRVVEKMMKTDVNQRYATMADVLQDMATTGIATTQPQAQINQESPVAVLSPEAPKLFEVATEAPQPAAIAASPKSNKFAAIIVTAVIVLLMGGAFAAKMFFIDKKPTTTTETNPLMASTNTSTAHALNPPDSTSTNRSENNPIAEPQSIDATASMDEQSSQDTINSETAGPESTTFAETPTVTQGHVAKPVVGSSTTDQFTTHNVSAISPSARLANSNTGSTPSLKKNISAANHSEPPANSCLISAVGDSDKADFVGSYVEEILGRKKYTIVDGPSVSNRSIATVARNHIVVTVKQLGTTTLNYYGSSSEQYTVALTFKVVSPGNGSVIAGPVSQTVKYTDLNAGENLKEAVRALISALKL